MHQPRETDTKFSVAKVGENWKLCKQKAKYLGGESIAASGHIIDMDLSQLKAPLTGHWCGSELVR